MSRSIKKVQRAVTGELADGEVFESGVFVNPFGFTSKLMAHELGGVIGTLIAGSNGADSGAVSDRGIAARFTDERLWIGITNKRVLTWSHGAVAGKPKKLLVEMPRADLVAVELEEHKMVHAIILRFADDTARLYEAPKLMNDALAFAAAANA